MNRPPHYNAFLKLALDMWGDFLILNHPFSLFGMSVLLVYGFIYLSLSLSANHDSCYNLIMVFPLCVGFRRGVVMLADGREEARSTSVMICYLLHGEEGGGGGDVHVMVVVEMP